MLIAKIQYFDPQLLLQEERGKLIGFKSLWVPFVCVAMVKEHKIMAQLRNICYNMDAMDISSGQRLYGI